MALLRIQSSFQCHFLEHKPLSNGIFENTKLIPMALLRIQSSFNGIVKNTELIPMALLRIKSLFQWNC